MKKNYLIDKGDYLFWVNNDAHLSAAEAKDLTHQIKERLERKNYKAMIVDNRNLDKIWSSDYDEIWLDLMRYLPDKVEKTASLCENVINKLQLDYLSKQLGHADQIKAFLTKEKEAMNAFLNHNVDDLFD